MKGYFKERGYYQAINAYCILYEVLLALYWESLEEHYSEVQEDLSRLDQLGSAIELFWTSLVNGANARIAFQEANDTLITLAPIMNAFETLRNASPTFAFWQQFLEILEIAMQFNHAERDCDWESHLTATSRMLPYLVVAHHPQYTRCLIQYLYDMQSLPQTFT